MVEFVSEIRDHLANTSDKTIIIAAAVLTVASSVLFIARLYAERWLHLRLMRTVRRWHALRVRR